MWNPENYTAAASLFPRLLGIIYLFAIIPFLFQILGLIGKNGILPVTDYLNHFRLHTPLKRFFYIPTLFWFNASDRALMGGQDEFPLISPGWIGTCHFSLLTILKRKIGSTNFSFIF